MEIKEKLIIKDIQSIKCEGKLPEERGFFSLEQIDESEMLIHGGCNSKKDFDQIHIFDLSKNNMNFLESRSWKSIQDVSTESAFLIFDKKLSGHTCNLVWICGSQKLIIFGGFTGESYVNFLYEVDIEGYMWTQIDVRGKGDYPFPRCYHSSNYDKFNNILLVYGGWNANISQQINYNFTSLWMYDLKSKYN